MLITVNEFRLRARTEVNDLVSELQLATGRYGEEEANAWKQSLPRLATVLSSESLGAAHLYVRDSGHLDLEYQLPSSGSFADVVLLGKHGSTPSALIIELKHWVTRADRPGRAEGLIERMGAQELHPSDQVRGYTEYCRHFHSAVQDFEARVDGCVLFTRDLVTAPYFAAPNEALAASYPIFTLAEDDTMRRLPEFLGTRLTEPHVEFATRFAVGRYRQERGFIRQIARQVTKSRSRPFELLDNQRRALSLCVATINDVLSRWHAGQAKRQVVAVIGPPGSGKSAVAARLWADVSMNKNVPDGDIIFCTTSMSQNANWTDIFEGAGGEGARGIVRKATTFHPLTTHRLGQLRQKFGSDFLAVAANWRANLEHLKGINEPFRGGANDLENLVSIVDEAHSLINPDNEGGIGQFGFAPTLGPQAYHIIRSSVLSIFFLDPEQGFRHRENTSIEDLRQWTRELDGGELEVVKLDGVQFRCGGSIEYVDWLESLLRGESTSRNQVLATAWHLPLNAGEHAYSNVTKFTPSQSVTENLTDGNERIGEKNHRSHRTSPFEFRVFDDPVSMENALRAAVRSGDTARLLSTYSRPWKTRGINNPHGLTPQQQDFCEPVVENGRDALWSRPWNFVPGGTDDYTLFVQGAPGSAIAADQLCEVGCPYAVRGFDYDYVGILWLEDLVWRSGSWKLNLDSVKESGVSVLVSQARVETIPGVATTTLLRKVCQAYRILATRALKGAFIWIKDEETRAHVLESLSSAGRRMS
jgi:uncharacterized protein